MANRALAPEVKSSPYFGSNSDVIATTDDGTREMGPLYPFVISGGSNTERFYFTHINDITPYKFNIRPRYFADESRYTDIFPKRIREILDANADAKIYCVFDWDTIYGDKSKEQKLLKKHVCFIKQFESEIASGIVTICQSMPSIEYWFLLHFEDYAGLLKNYSQVSNRLGPHIKPYFSVNEKIKLSKLLKRECYLEKPSWVKKMCEDGKLKNAIERAERHIKE